VLGAVPLSLGLAALLAAPPHDQGACEAMKRAAHSPDAESCEALSEAFSDVKDASLALAALEIEACRLEVAEQLGGPDFTPDFVWFGRFASLLVDPRPPVRVAILAILENMAGHPCRPLDTSQLAQVTRTFEKALGDTDPEVREAVLEGLDQVPEAAGPILPAIAEELRSPPTRDRALSVIGAIGPPARPLGAELRRLRAGLACGPSGTDAGLCQHLDATLTAIAADRTDEQLRAEDAIVAAVVRHHLHLREKKDEPICLSLSGHPLGSEVLRRIGDSHAVSGPSCPSSSLVMALDAPVWRAGDFVEIPATFDAGMMSRSGGEYVVVRRGDEWRVLTYRGTWIE
jgi:hypothetical protein